MEETSQPTKQKSADFWLFICIALAFGMLVGQMFGYWRASIYFEGVKEIKEYSFSQIISDLDGNTTYLTNLGKIGRASCRERV